MVISSVLGALGVDLGGGEGSTSAPQGETVFLALGFAGMAVGLAVALPIYLRERWPQAFLGQVGDGPARSSTPVTMATAVAAGLGLVCLYWALGGSLGLDPARGAHMGVTAEYTMVAVVQHALSIGAGLTFMVVILRGARRAGASR
ncbi:hypothetical protein [Nonomuraea dietziae]|uniref:Uncharacterized protein n=1 Tax=Nonomuraea dietziae TaxID=65515 RepID=A0A7W5VDP1_9ACTN|nr:hypothetical protein [Nonomuraea dietziae]MBB3725792.1 hypothetical protein [Nonomuraea dietziae]